MTITEQVSAAEAEYERAFRVFPNSQWYDGDAEEYIRLIKNAVVSGEVLPEYEHDLSFESLT